MNIEPEDKTAEEIDAERVIFGFANTLDELGLDAWSEDEDYRLATRLVRFTENQ